MAGNCPLSPTSPVNALPTTSATEYRRHFLCKRSLMCWCVCVATLAVRDLRKWLQLIDNKMYVCISIDYRIELKHSHKKRLNKESCLKYRYQLEILINNLSFILYYIQLVN